MGKVLLIFGPQGAGKSTHALALAKCGGRRAFFNRRVDGRAVRLMDHAN